MKAKKNDILMQNKVFGWIAIGTAMVLLLPLIAMQFTNEVNWSLGDFVIIGTLLFGSGSLFVYVARVTPRKYRLVIGALFVAIVLWIWAELAVGVFTNWGS